MTYKDKVIWITGASSGIGEAMTYAFAAEGAQLIISARRTEELERVKGNCPQPNLITIAPLDIAKYDNLNETVARVLEPFGHIDLLFNNAGISQRALVKDTSMEVYERLFQVNVLGTIAMTKAVLPYMLEQQSGHIAVISSLTGKFSTPLRSGYAASKHALHGFFDGLRSETVKENLKVTIICPGFVQTNVSKNALKGDGVSQGVTDEAIANGMTPEELAQRALKALKKGKEEVYIAGPEIRGVYLKRFFPELFSKFIAKAKVT